MAALLLSACGGDPKPARPIPEWLFFPSELLSVARAKMAGAPALVASPRLRRFLPVDAAQPIAHVAAPQHPFMAANAGNNMHNDASMSDTYEARGPIGVDPVVTSRSRGFGGYGTITVDRAGRLVGVYSNGRGFELHLLDPKSLALSAAHPLPSRPWYWLLQGIPPWKYIGAGTYFYLDSLDQAVVPTTHNSIEILRVPSPDRDAGFELVRAYDLSTAVVPMSWPYRDSIAWVLPDWRGDYYWYATTAGMIGTVGVRAGDVHTYPLAGEIVENSFAIGEDGVYIVSDHALYRFRHDGSGSVIQDWRTPYERGSRIKPGHMTRGSGTSVTLVGESDGFVVITDNAEPRVHLLFVRRDDGRVACRTPLFEPNASGTDISAVAFEQARTESAARRYSAIVENNFGDHAFPVAHPYPGITRVDMTKDTNGEVHCEAIWTSQEANIGVFKLSLGSGLLYTYFRDPGEAISQWDVSAIDFHSGATAFKYRVGAGQGYNNWAGALFLHPDGALYSTTIFGLMRLQDRPGA